jgi:hypothetical protein
MYKLSTSLVVTYFPTYLFMYESYFLQNWLWRWNQILTRLRVHPQLRNNGHPVDDALVGAGFIVATIENCMCYALHQNPTQYEPWLSTYWVVILLSILQRVPPFEGIAILPWMCGYLLWNGPGTLPFRHYTLPAYLVSLF